MIDPISDMESAILDLGAVRFAAGEKRYGVLVDEGHVPQVEYELAPRRLCNEQLLKMLDVVRLYPAAESVHHVPVC